MERIISFIKGADSEKVSNGLLTTSFLSVFVVFWLFSRFLKYNETRPGLALYDPILSSIGPYDHNLSIFLLTYGLVLFGLYWALQNRIGMLTTNLSICFLIAFRAFTLFSFPLEPPTGILPLQDLFLKNTFYCQEVLLKDLFFSGHTASVFLLYFLIPQKWVKRVLLIGGLSLGFLLMHQHVHYSIDILAAPFFSWIAYQGACFARKYILGSEMELESIEIAEK